MRCFKQTCHLAFAGYAKVDAFRVLDACVFHVGDYAWAFPGEVDSDLLESAPTVLQQLSGNLKLERTWWAAGKSSDAAKTAYR